MREFCEDMEIICQFCVDQSCVRDECILIDHEEYEPEEQIYSMQYQQDRISENEI